MKKVKVVFLKNTEEYWAL